jgi:hypothetical protein
MREPFLMLAVRLAHNLITRLLRQMMMHLDGLGAPFGFRYRGRLRQAINVPRIRIG